MEALYSKLYDKYTKLKTKKENEMEELNRDQEMKFMTYMSAADDLIEHLRSEHDKLSAEVSELRSEVASIRYAKDQQDIEHQKQLLEENRKYKELSEEIERLRNKECHSSFRDDEFESDKPVSLPAPPRVVKGRPKWNRRKDALEDGRGKGTNEILLLEDPFKNIKKSKKEIKVTCRLCKQEGHNIRKCPNKPVNENSRLVESAPRREKQPVRRMGSRSGFESMGERNNGLDGSTSKVGMGSGPPNVQAAFQPSFSRRGRTFITGHALQNQSKSQQKKPRH